MKTAANRTSAPRRRTPIVSAHEIRARLAHEVAHEVAQEVAWQDVAGGPATGTRALTSRERDVVRGVVAGLGNDQIARRLGISRWTVVNHLRRVMQKWGCGSRVEVAVRFSTIPPDVARPGAPEGAAS